MRKCTVCMRPLAYKCGVRVYGSIADPNSSTGGTIIIDSCVVCVDCYKKYFPYLAFRGKISDKKERKSK